jgi:hypothetical protein
MRILRIALRIDENTSQAQVFRSLIPNLRRAAEVDSIDLEVGSSVTENVDCWIIHQLRLANAAADGPGRLLTEVKSLGTPYILLERLDGANITGITRQLLCSECPPVSCWKLSRYVDPSLYNRFSGRWHLELCIRQFEEFSDLAAIPPKQPRLRIPADRLDRIKAPFDFGSFPGPQAILRQRSRALNRNRPIDVSFSGTVDYDDAVLTRHRRACHNAIINLQLDAELDVRIALGRGRPLNAEEYADELFDSKIVVCPAGWGECTYREHEAAFAGCLVIRPSCCSHVDGPQTPFVCKPDFSDLPLVVAAALECWANSGTDADQFQEQMIERADPRAIGERLWQDIKAAAQIQPVLAPTETSTSTGPT